MSAGGRRVGAPGMPDGPKTVGPRLPASVRREDPLGSRCRQRLARSIRYAPGGCGAGRILRAGTGRGRRIQGRGTADRHGVAAADSGTGEARLESQEFTRGCHVHGVGQAPGDGNPLAPGGDHPARLRRRAGSSGSPGRRGRAAITRCGLLWTRHVCRTRRRFRRPRLRSR